MLHARTSPVPRVIGSPVATLLLDRGLENVQWQSVGGALVTRAAADPYGAAAAAAVFTEDASGGEHGVSIAFAVVQKRRYRVLIEIGNPSSLPSRMFGVFGVRGPVFSMPGWAGYNGPGTGVSLSDGTFAVATSGAFSSVNMAGDEAVLIPPSFGRISINIIASASGAAQLDVRSLFGFDGFSTAANLSFVGDGVSTITLCNARIYEIQDY